MEKIYTQKELEEACKDAYNDGFIDGRKIGWIESAIDGEGCLGLGKIKRKKFNTINYEPTLYISTSDYYFVENFRDYCGLTELKISPHTDKRFPNRKTMYRLLVYGVNNLKPLLEKIELITKEEQRQLLLEAFELRPGRGFQFSESDRSRLEEIYERVKELNS